jgi:hypothetical protein
MTLNKKTAWIDCNSGAAGGMLLGALIDLGFPQSRLAQLAKAFKLGRVRIQITREKRSGISGILVRITPQGHQPERHFQQIKKIIARAALPELVKQKSIEAFLALAKAEAKVHGEKIEHIHFHELGAVDTIIDIVGVILGFHELKIENVFSSPLRLGSGEVKCAHGTLPVPAPATLELLQGLPVMGGKPGDGELVTPTGASLIRTLAGSFGPMPEMIVQKIGYGLGERSLTTRPNALRIALGKAQGKVEQLIQIETTIDDMNPEFFAPLIKAVSEAGALETALVPAQLKKNRPGTILRVLCPRPELESILQLIFRHSTTTGIRYYEVDRIALSREIINIRTSWGKVPAKKIEMPNGEVRIHPEYEPLAKLSEKLKIPVIELEQKVKQEWLKKQARIKS